MKTLIVYYSRTGTTRKVAELLREKLQGDVEELIDHKDRSGAVGWMMAGKDAMKKVKASIGDLKSDAAGYDLVVVGTPVWAGTMAAAVRTFMESYRGKLPKVAFFTTQGGAQRQRVFEDLKEIAGSEPVAELMLRTAAVKKGEHTGMIEEFIDTLQSKI